MAEVRRRLTQAGYRTDLVEAAIARLLDLGILDDAAFARAWVESRDRARPRGEIALRRELALKGVDRQVVDAALAERSDASGGMDGGDGTPDEADRERAQRLLARHARTLERERDPRRRRQRAYALLARNGFPPDVAGEASRAWADEEATAEE